MRLLDILPWSWTNQEVLEMDGNGCFLAPHLFEKSRWIRETLEGIRFFFRFRQVSLPRPVLGALCGAIGEDLPLMSEEVRRWWWDWVLYGSFHK